MNIKEVKIIIDDFKKSDLMSLELETKEFKLKLSKRQDETIQVETNNKSAVIKKETNKINNIHEIKAPLVGTFYSAASPEQEPFAKVGKKVAVGDVVCIIEAMKIMNEITSNVNGIISEVVVANNSIVGFDDVLFKVDPNDSK